MASTDQTEAAAACGIPVIEAHLRTLPHTPGVYRMLNAAGDVLYVGKAKNLKKRVAAYCRPERIGPRIRRMVQQTVALEVVTTHTEAEALLLEANLIKRFLPRYNILLRDDKSFPSILVTGDHAFPRVLKVRGARDRKGAYFGPFASAWAVNETLTVLQRAFLLRTCSDAVFAARTRPCLLHQIKRCSAPCVQRIGEADYRALVDQARRFLCGESQQIQQELAKRMQEASERLDFEEAAQYRDRIQALTRIQSHQGINVAGIGTADVVAAHQEGGHTGIQVFFFRAGRNYGNRAYFPSHAQDEGVADVLEAFLGQFYANKMPPPLVLVSHKTENLGLVADALSVKAERKVRVECPARGDKHKLVGHALANAREALVRRVAEGSSHRRLLDELAAALDLEAAPERIEVYDNSHVQGTNAVGAMIVAGPDGFIKNAYRKFNIRGIAPAPASGEEEAAQGASPGDDLAMMREVLSRRFSRALREDPERARGQWPDLVFIDGGAGQLDAALSVLAGLGIEDLKVVGVAKGVDRNAGRERLFVEGRDPIVLDRRSPVLYLIQRLRDEAHRFAIGTHRARRGKALRVSTLDGIPGIGAKRKKALLHHFGSSRAVSEAGLEDLEAVDGIDRAIAKKVYDWFHEDG